MLTKKNFRKALELLKENEQYFTSKEIEAIILKEGYISCIGHQSTAILLSNILNQEIPMNRIQIKLNSGDKLIVFQVLVRLEEGKILTLEEMNDLLKKDKIGFYLVEVL